MKVVNGKCDFGMTMLNLFIMCINSFVALSERSKNEVFEGKNVHNADIQNMWLLLSKVKDENDIL